MQYSRLVRVVERYAGSFVCFIFSLLHKLRSTPKSREIKKVLVIELVEMGAAVMAYSSLTYIRKQIPDAEIHCLCLNSKKESWLLLDEIPRGNVHFIDDRSTGRLVLSLLKQTRALSRQKFDLIIDFELFLRISAIIAFLIRAKFRAGFYRYTMEGMYRGTFYDIKCAFNQNMHIAKNLLALTKSAIALNTNSYNYDGPIPASEIVAPRYTSDGTLRKVVEAKLNSASGSERGPLILVAPTVGLALPIRDYPKEQYVDVIKKLLQLYPTHRVVLVGSQDHKAVCASIRESVDDARCVDFAGETASLRELVELFGMGELLISNDSGNPHFAAMVGLPSLVLFGPETPFIYGPLGKSVCLFQFFHTSPALTAYNHKNDPGMTNRCLASITQERVVETAALIMAGKATYRTINNEAAYLV